MDQEIIITINANAFDETPVALQMNIFDAAKVMMTFKRAKLCSEEPAPPTPVKSDPVALPARKGSAKKGDFLMTPRNSVGFPLRLAWKGHHQAIVY